MSIVPTQSQRAANEAYGRGRIDGAKEERARIVAELREMAAVEYKVARESQRGSMSEMIGKIEGKAYDRAGDRIEAMP